MRQMITLSLVSLFVLGTMSVVMAAGGAKMEHHKGGDTHKVVGEVDSVDANARTLVVKETLKKEGGEAKEMTFNFTEKASIMMDGKAATIADLQAGDSVTVHYQATPDGKNEAREIVVA